MTSAAQGALQFLFNGQQPPSTPSYSQTSTQLPPWYTGYAQNAVDTASQFASNPYQIYGGPLVAGFTPQQTQAFGDVGNAASAYNGYAGTGAGMITNAVNSPSALTAAAPWLNPGSTNMNSYVQNFMNNPGLQGELGTINTMAGQNWNENIMPSLQNTFTAAGQLAGPGSTRMTDEAQIAARNLQQSTSMADASLLGGAYNTAVGAAGQQVGANVNAGSTAGGLQLAGQQLGVTAGGMLPTVGSTGLNTALTGANALYGAGAAQQNLAQQNLGTAAQQFYQQENAPITGLQIANTGLNGVQIPSANVSYGYGVNPYAVNASTTSGLGQIGNLLNTYSDRRLKTNIVEIGKTLLGLPIYEFEYIGKRGRHVGVMADEVEEVLPHAVHFDRHGFRMVDYSQVA
jgi:hypothetical protein